VRFRSHRSSWLVLRDQFPADVRAIRRHDVIPRFPGVALAPAAVRHLRVNGVTHRPLTAATAGVPLAIAYKDGPDSPLVRRDLETTRTVMRSQQTRAKQATVTTDYEDVGSLLDSV
jgi:hypothetical protein